MQSLIKFLKKAWLVQAFLFCTACASVESRIDSAQEIMQAHGYQGKTLTTQPFPLYAAFKGGIQPDPLRIVIEGDGYAWVDRYTLSDNPTPKDPIGLKIATALDRPGYYLARPCQYIESGNCEASLWSSARFSEAVIASYMQALDQIQAETHNENLHLIGFSGGAYIAIVLASRRDDVVNVTTVAGLLDPDQWTAMQDISPVETPETAEAILQNTQGTNFIHFCGGEDEIIPCEHAQAFIQKAHAMGLRNQSLVAFKTENHQSLWQKAVPKISP